MATNQSTSRLAISHAGATGLARVWNIVARLGGDFVAGLGGLANARADAMLRPAVRDTCDLRYVSERMSQALLEDSNLEIDWLYHASRVERDEERCYCLQRALEINPHNAWARREVARLS